MAGGINNIGNLLGKVDSNNALVVALASGSTIDAPVFTGVSSFPDGTAAAPSIAFTSDTDTGIYRVGADSIGFSTGGAAKARLSTGIGLPSTGAAPTVGNAILVGGTVTVSTTAVLTGDVVMLTRKTSGGTIGTAVTYTISNGASFTITTDNILDTSTFSWMVIKTF